MLADIRSPVPQAERLWETTKPKISPHTDFKMIQHAEIMYQIKFSNSNTNLAEDLVWVNYLDVLGPLIQTKTTPPYPKEAYKLYKVIQRRGKGTRQ